MSPRRVTAIAALCGLLAGCSLVTTWDGLTPGDQPAADAGADAPPSLVEAGACAESGRYCGGDKVGGSPDSLYRCNGDGTASLLEACAYGCIVRPAGQDDTCQCQPGGYYCGGDKVEGDPSTLYQCNTDGTGSAVNHCANGCVVVPNQDDTCG
jgi:hypothetical protein